MSLPTSRRPGVNWPTILIVGTVSLIILVILNPWLILSATTPTGGDTGAHVFGPAFLRDVLLPDGRIQGWSNDWFAGFPVFYFYFPLPSLVIVLFDLLLPYGVAFKIVTVMGIVGLPFAAYFHARCLNLARPTAIVAGASGAVFAFLESYSIYGGNIASTLAGEFSYSWSFALSLVYLGFLIRAVRDDRRFVKWAALALALTALSHVLTTIVVIFASLFVFRWRKSIGRTLIVWLWGFSIAAFWALPLITRIGFTSDMGWIPLTRLEEVFPVEIWLLLPLALFGAGWCLRRSSRAAPLIAATLLPVIYYPLPTLLPEVLPDVFGGERWKLWNGRLLPYWYFGLAFFAAVAAGAAVMWASRRIPARISMNWSRLLLVVITAVSAGLVADSTDFPEFAWLVFVAGGLLMLAASFFWGESTGSRHFLTVFVTGVVALGALAGVTYVDSWARGNYRGYEAGDNWEEYNSLMQTIEGLPDGRIQWEGNSAWGQYGTTLSPMLIPYWTEGSHTTMEGLFYESSLTTPFHFINSSEMSMSASNPIPGLQYHNFQMDRGLKHLDLYGINYYVSITPEAGEAADAMESMNRIGTVGPFGIFELPPSPLVVTATFEPSVYDVPDRGLVASLVGAPTVTGEDGQELHSFHDFVLGWYDNVAMLDKWIVADGPPEWPRIESLDELNPIALTATDGSASDIVLEEQRIAFKTTAIGVPHLVKISYFPNWVASGAEGPYRASPSLMVVVPTQEDVVLEFEDTWAESGGRLLTLLGIGALLVVGGLIAFRQRKVASRPPEAA